MFRRVAVLRRNRGWIDQFLRKDRGYQDQPHRNGADQVIHESLPESSNPAIRARSGQQAVRRFIVRRPPPLRSRRPQLGEGVITIGLEPDEACVRLDDDAGRNWVKVISETSLGFKSLTEGGRCKKLREARDDTACDINAATGREGYGQIACDGTEDGAKHL